MLSFDNRYDVFQLVSQWTLRMKISSNSKLEPINITALALTLQRYLEKKQALAELKENSLLSELIRKNPVSEDLRTMARTVVAGYGKVKNGGVNNETTLQLSSLRNYRDGKFFAHAGRLAQLSRRVAKSLIYVPLRSRKGDKKNKIGRVELPSFKNFDKDFTVIPDVHENIYGLLHTLESSGWIDAEGKLITNGNAGKILIQMGDNINRNVSANGLAVLQLWARLWQQAKEFNDATDDPTQHIQIHTLLGNHELDLLKWESQQLDTNFTTAESRSIAERARDLLQQMVRSGALLGAFYLGNPDLAAEKKTGALLVHAGILPDVLSRMKQEIGSANVTGVEMASYINQELIKAIGDENPSGYSQAVFNHFLFSKSAGRSKKEGPIVSSDPSGPFEAEFSPRKEGDSFEQFRKLGIIDGDGKKLLTDEEIIAKLEDLYGGLLIWVGHNFYSEDNIGIRHADTSGIILPAVLILDGGDGQVGKEFNEETQTAVIRRGQETFQIYVETEEKKKKPSSLQERGKWIKDIGSGILPREAVAFLDQRQQRSTRANNNLPVGQVANDQAERISLLDEILNKDGQKVNTRTVALIANKSQQIQSKKGQHVGSSNDYVFALKGEFTGNLRPGQFLPEGTLVESDSALVLLIDKKIFEETLENNAGFQNFMKEQGVPSLTTPSTLRIGRWFYRQLGLTRTDDEIRTEFAPVFEVLWFFGMILFPPLIYVFYRAHLTKPSSPNVSIGDLDRHWLQKGVALVYGVPLLFVYTLTALLFHFSSHENFLTFVQDSLPLLFVIIGLATLMNFRMHKIFNINSVKQGKPALTTRNSNNESPNVLNIPAMPENLATMNLEAFIYDNAVEFFKLSGKIIVGDKEDSETVKFLGKGLTGTVFRLQIQESDGQKRYVAVKVASSERFQFDVINFEALGKDIQIFTDLYAGSQTYESEIPDVLYLRYYGKVQLKNESEEKPLMIFMEFAEGLPLNELQPIIEDKALSIAQNTLKAIISKGNKGFMLQDENGSNFLTNGKIVFPVDLASYEKATTTEMFFPAVVQNWIYANKTYVPSRFMKALLALYDEEVKWEKSLQEITKRAKYMDAIGVQESLEQKLSVLSPEQIEEREMLAILSTEAEERAQLGILLDRYSPKATAVGLEGDNKRRAEEFDNLRKVISDHYEDRTNMPEGELSEILPAMALLSRNKNEVVGLTKIEKPEAPDLKSSLVMVYASGSKTEAEVVNEANKSMGVKTVIALEATLFDSFNKKEEYAKQGIWFVRNDDQLKFSLESIKELTGVEQLKELNFVVSRKTRFSDTTLASIELLKSSSPELVGLYLLLNELNRVALRINSVQELADLAKFQQRLIDSQA
ncbi:MAG: metallophosphoesterase [Elusimicrobiota bacterium]